MRALIEMLYAVEDVKTLAPYKWQTCDVIWLEMQIQDKAKTVRERVYRYAFVQLAGHQGPLARA